MEIRKGGPDTLKDWAHLRQELWPKQSVAEHRLELEALLGVSKAYVAFLAYDDAGQAVGFAEAALRHDHVNGCTSSPVAFLEGIYVPPDHRRQGVARRLCDAVEAWGRAQGCSEFASDASIDNRLSHSMHIALGFAETERVVYFRKRLVNR